MVNYLVYSVIEKKHSYFAICLQFIADCVANMIGVNSFISKSPSRHQTGKSTSGDDSRKSPRQRPSTTDGMRGDAQSKHGYISSRRTKGTTETSAYTAGERLIRDQQTKVCLIILTTLKPN